MKHASYLRVSTPRQGHTGYGIEAQRADIRALLGREPDAEFSEVESGRRRKRPVLAKALDYCRQHEAELIVARVDRLTRDVGFLLSIVNGNVPLRFADFPAIPGGAAGRFVLISLANAAELESRLMGERIKAAQAAWRLRNPGKRLGYPRISETLNARHIADAAAFAEELRERLADCMRLGLTHIQMAERLNKLQVPTARGGRWHPTQVRRILVRLKITAPDRRLRAGGLNLNQTSMHSPWCSPW